MDNDTCTKSFRRHIQAAIAALESSTPTASREVGAVRARVAVLKELLASSEGEVPGAGLAELGSKLRAARLKAGLTQEQAASRAGISLMAFRNCERAYRTTSEETIAKLSRVPELGIGTVLAAPGSNADQAPSWWIDARFEPLQMLSELRHTLNSSGGNVEQSLMYLDHKSGADFMALSSGARYNTGYRNRMPLERVVQAVRECTGDQDLDIISLGAGDGRQEVAITEMLADSFASPDIRLILLDISQPLLTEAYRYAWEVFEKRRGVSVFGFQGNFHHLPAFPQLHFRPSGSKRRRVLTMLGSTLSNLDDEIQFFRHSLGPFSTGDVLVLDYHETAPQPWELNDTALQRQVPDAHQEFFAGPIWRYCRGVTGVSMRYELGQSQVVPGSYAIEANATVTTRGGEKKFTMFKFKRYDSAKLATALKGAGWEVATAFPYGAKVEQNPNILVLRKRK